MEDWKEVYAFDFLFWNLVSWDTGQTKQEEHWGMGEMVCFMSVAPFSWNIGKPLSFWTGGQHFKGILVKGAKLHANQFWMQGKPERIGQFCTWHKISLLDGFYNRVAGHIHEAQMPRVFQMSLKLAARLCRLE